MRHIAFILLFVLAACATPAGHSVEERAQEARLTRVSWPLITAARDQCVEKGFAKPGIGICEFYLTVRHNSATGAWSFDDSSEIMVSIKLMEFMNSDSEVAFVLGHEMAHKLLGHTFTNDVDKGTAQEIEADRLALEIAAKAGFDIKTIPAFARRYNGTYRGAWEKGSYYEDAAQKKRRFDALQISVGEILSRS